MSNHSSVVASRIKEFDPNTNQFAPDDSNPDSVSNKNFTQLGSLSIPSEAGIGGVPS